MEWAYSNELIVCIALDRTSMVDDQATRIWDENDASSGMFLRRLLGAR